MESNTRWQKVDRGTLESEKLSRPSLTYWQDCLAEAKKEQKRHIVVDNNCGDSACGNIRAHVLAVFLRSAES